MLITYGPAHAQDIDVARILSRFLLSPWAPDGEYGWGTTRRLRAFLGAPAAQGGMAATFDEEEFAGLLELARTWECQARALDRQQRFTPCLCGCGAACGSRSALFLPGHDMKLRGRGQRAYASLLSGDDQMRRGESASFTDAQRAFLARHQIDLTELAPTVLWAGPNPTP